MEIVVEDANIIIDLLKTGLIRFCDRLNVTFHTTDLVYREIKNEEQSRMMGIAVRNGMITVDTFEGVDAISLIAEIARYSRMTNLTPGDCSVLMLAEKMKCRLLTTDQKLKRQAEARNIKVNGFLWLTDLMVEKGVVSQPAMIDYLERLKATNRSAPVHLIDERIEKYSNHKK